MKKITATFDVPDNVTIDQLKVLLQDALGEFKCARVPVDTYFQKRYPDGVFGKNNPVKNEKKKDEISERIQLAHDIISSLDITEL